MINHLRNYWGLYFIIAIVLLIVLSPKLNNSAESLKPKEAQIKSGELSAGNESQNTEGVNDNNINQDSELLNDPTWIDPALKTGNTPKGLVFSPKRDNSTDNYLEVCVGNNTDVVVKLVRKDNDQTIRYVYVKGTETYRIKNIPQALYYLKIAYGRNWRQKEVNGQLVGKFLSNAQYEIGTETLDYHYKYGAKETTSEGYTQNYSIPSYSVELNVISSSAISNFDTNSISESEFNQ